MTELDDIDPITAGLAVLGSFALGLCGLVFAITAGVRLFSGELLAVAFAGVAALAFGAGELLRRRLPSVIIPIACGAVLAGELATTIRAVELTDLDATVIAGALFAAWTWWRYSRPHGEAKRRCVGSAVRDRV